jgi:hypothetical protein
VTKRSANLPTNIDSLTAAERAKLIATSRRARPSASYRKELSARDNSYSKREMGRVMLVQVTGKTFCAGAIFERGHVVHAAPFLCKTLGWNRDRFARHFRARGCSIEVVECKNADGQNNVRK